MPLLALTVAGVLNVILNLFFVIVLHMTVNGVAIATVLSNVVSSVLLFIKLRKSDTFIHVEVKDIKFHREAFTRIMSIGLPAGIQSAAYNIEVFAYDVLNSFSQACTTFVGQNYGAGKIGRCKRTLALCLVEDAIASALSIVLILFAGRFLLSIFNNDPEVIELGYTRLVIIFIAYIFSMMYEVMSGYLRGFGISVVPAVITTVGVCVVRIIWINVVFPMNRTFQTIMTAFPVSLALTAVGIFIALIIYRPSRRFAGKKGINTAAVTAVKRIYNNKYRIFYGRNAFFRKGKGIPPVLLFQESFNQ